MFWNDWANAKAGTNPFHLLSTDPVLSMLIQN